MEELLQRARAYLSGLEADRNAALALSEQKAEEAKLIKARQEGFQAALQLFSGKLLPAIARRERRELSADRRGHGERASQPQETRRRRVRRPIREMIFRELSFSGQVVTAAQIAKAVNYTPERTERVLTRMERDGRVVRDEAGRWAIGLAGTRQIKRARPRREQQKIASVVGLGRL
jgi:hypothetical protein